FVGAGAALKRLNRTRLRDVRSGAFPPVSVDDPRRTVLGRLADGPHGELRVLDRRRRPRTGRRRGDVARAEGVPARAGGAGRGT
ncbi:polyamine ABC transporter ATP-binding protein, partial [Streptomyces lavendulocolor]